MNMGHRFRLIAVLLAILIPCGIAYNEHVELMQAQQEIQQLKAELSKSHEAEVEALVSHLRLHPENEDQEDTEYIANARTGIFHRADCQYVAKMNPDNEIEYDSRDDAIDDGYRPCKKCRP